MDRADSSSHAELGQFLQQELDALKADPEFRIRWLLEQIGNYVDRWVDKQSLSPSPGPDDLFTMIEVAAEAMREEFHSRDGELNRDWMIFTTVLASVPNANPPIGEGLRESFQKAQTAILKVFG